jgi:hypothetical protein
VSYFSFCSRFAEEIIEVAGADMSTGLGESHDASGRLEAIEGGLRDQRRQALTTLDGVRIL